MAETKNVYVPPGVKEPKKEEPKKELAKGMREAVEAVMKKHAAADPNMPSVTEALVRSLGLRSLQLLAEAEALAAQVSAIEVPEEDEEKRAEAKKNEAALKAHQDKKEKEHA
jgi:hypothetical protein